MNNTIIIILLVLSGCRSASKLVDLARQRDPSIFVTDTVRTTDTVWLEVKRIDTLFKYQFDTVEFIKDSVKIKYFYVYEDSLVYLDVDCPDCPRVTNSEVITETITIEPTFWERLMYCIYGVVAVLGLFAFTNFIRRLHYHFHPVTPSQDCFLWW